MNVVRYDLEDGNDNHICDECKHVREYVIVILGTRICKNCLERAIKLIDITEIRDDILDNDDWNLRK